MGGATHPLAPTHDGESPISAGLPRGRGCTGTGVGVEERCLASVKTESKVRVDYTLVKLLH